MVSAMLCTQLKTVLIVSALPGDTDKPAEVRMGKGKGAVDHWAARVAPGRIMFEIDGVPDDVAREALRLGAAKLPIRTKVVTRLDAGIVTEQAA